MNPLRELLQRSPTHARVAPFFIFVALTFGQAAFGPDAKYWFYLLKTIAGVWIVWEMRAAVAEARWAFSWEAVLVGVIWWTGKTTTPSNFARLVGVEAGCARSSLRSGRTPMESLTV